MSGTVDRGSAAPGAEPASGDKPVRMGVLGDYIYFHLRMAQHASFRAFERQAGLPGLRPGWFAVLSLINDNPGITPLVLSRASGRDKSTITPILRDLVRERMILRVEIPADRRSYALRLAPQGEEALAHLAACAAAHDRDLSATAGEQREMLLDLLRRIVAAMERSD